MELISFIKTSFKGQASFKSAYLTLGIPIIIVQVLLIFATLFITDIADNSILLLVVKVLGYFVHALFVFWVFVIFRCSDNVIWKGWPVLAGISLLFIYFLPTAALVFVAYQSVNI